MRGMMVEEIKINAELINFSVVFIFNPDLVVA